MASSTEVLNQKNKNYSEISKCRESSYSETKNSGAVGKILLMHFISLENNIETQKYRLAAYSTSKTFREFENITALSHWKRWSTRVWKMSIKPVCARFWNKCFTCILVLNTFLYFGKKVNAFIRHYKTLWDFCFNFLKSILHNINHLPCEYCFYKNERLIWITDSEKLRVHSFKLMHACNVVFNRFFSCFH